MSEQAIYTALRSGGLSRAGACAMLGNMFCESGLVSNNVEDRCTLGDLDYTRAVDTGTISRYQWKTDAYGYGLCQWTYPTRKEGLYDLAKERGVSVGDEQTQCDYCISELVRDFPKLYEWLCTTDDLPDATRRICSEYERPAVNNFADRINAAQRFYNQLADDTDDSCTGDACEIDFSEETCTVNVRVLRRGSLGRDVFLLQAGLFDMGFDCGLPDGDFGVNTEEAVREFQRSEKVEPTGKADLYVWQTVLNAR